MVSTYGFWMLNVAAMAGKQFGLDELKRRLDREVRRLLASRKNSRESRGLLLSRLSELLQWGW